MKKTVNQPKEEIRPTFDLRAFFISVGMAILYPFFVWFVFSMFLRNSDIPPETLLIPASICAGLTFLAGVKSKNKILGAGLTGGGVLLTVIIAFASTSMHTFKIGNILPFMTLFLIIAYGAYTVGNRVES